MSHQDHQDRNSDHDDNNKDGKLAKVFDWVKAAKLIKEYHIQNASVGYDRIVEEKFNILKNGNPVTNNDNKMQLFDGANPVLIDNDRGEIMNCFVVIDVKDKTTNSIIIHSSKSGKLEISLRWPKDALDIIDRPFYRKDIQESKYFQILITNPLLYIWPLLVYE